MRKCGVCELAHFFCHDCACVSTKTCIVILTPRLIKKNAFNYYLIIYVIVHSFSTKKDQISTEMVKTQCSV